MRFAGFVTALVLILPTGSAIAGDAGTKCFEKRRRVSRLEAQGVTCPVARWVARRYDEKRIKSGHWPAGSSTIGRFSCRTRRTGPETFRIRCQRDADEIVRFRWGV
jgi:hypothetical protein